jgi:hypothetical protein
MRFSKAALPVLMCGMSFAQQPIGVTQVGIDGKNTGTQINYFSVATNGGTPQGDTPYFTAWGASSLFSIGGNGFPDQSGLPIIGTWNDGSTSAPDPACSGNLGLVQLSKLPALGVTATSGNTKITGWANCMSTYSAGGISTAPSGTWNDTLTWKGAVLAFRNNILLLPFFRQNNAGTSYGDASMVVSFDAGAHFVDYGRWQGYAVIGADCSAGTATLTLSSITSAGGETLANGNTVYVHDVGGGYDGQQASITVSGSTISYSITCPGTTPNSGYVALLDKYGSAPLGPLSGGYKMMWPVSAGGRMNTMKIINYGQDGNYPGGIEGACDPTQYVCFTAIDKTQSDWPMFFGRFPIANNGFFNKSAYEWYYCPGYTSYWPVEDSVCDFSQSANRTGTLANATVILHTGNASVWPGEREMLTYLPAFGSYLLSGITRDYQNIPPGGGRISWHWAPHPWGPFYPITQSSCVETGNGGATAYCDPGFNAALAFQAVTNSTAPPAMQLRYTADSFSYSSGGNPVFGEVDVATGRVPVNGMARRANYINTAQLGMGHRFVSGGMAGAIPRRGLSPNGGTYNIAWWTDVWDHGGDTYYPTRAVFRDVISGGTKYFGVYDQESPNPRYAHANSLVADGVQASSGGYSERMQSSFTDSTFSANAGNSSWTLMGAIKTTTIGAITGYAGMGGTVTGGTPTQITVTASQHTAGDLCIRWGTGNGHTDFCTTSGVITANTWYFFAVSASANGSGYPTITMYIGNGGTITEYGGVNMATSANGTTGGGLTKRCGSYCATTPAVLSDVVYLGTSYPGWYSIAGTNGEYGAYSGVVPGHVIREIYRTIRVDWARVGRGAI